MTAVAFRGAVPAAKANPVPRGSSPGIGGARPPTPLARMPFGVRICGWAVESVFVSYASAQRYASHSARTCGYGFEVIDLASESILCVCLA